MTSADLPQSDLLASAEAARREGNPLALYDRAGSAIHAGDMHPRFRYLQVLALAQMGDTGRAEALYERYGLGNWAQDEDALALRGRLHKDRGLAASELTAGRRQFQRASEAYLRAFAVRSGYFPGINAATTAWAAGDPEAARGLALRMLIHPDLNPAKSFFASASRAEALTLLGRPGEAAETLNAALGDGLVGHGDRAAAFRQLEWLSAGVDMSPAERRALLDTLRPSPVITYTGHMFLADAAPEIALRARIDVELDSLDVKIAYGALACGADILFAEAILHRGGELHVIMPFLTAPFIESSVRPGGDSWITRFDDCLERAASVTFATRMDYVGHDRQFTYGAQLASGLARLRAAQLTTRAVQLAVWDGRPARGLSGSAVDVDAGRGMGLETRIIPPGEIDRNFARTERDDAVTAPKHVARAILFTDYQGYSRLPESLIPVFNREVMGAVARVLNGHGRAVCSRNTWGDALYAVITETAHAADIALEIIEALERVSFVDAEKTILEGMRIGLHFGPVYQEIDPVTGHNNFYGSEVTLTARIEPQAVSGQIYTTQAFAAILAVTAPDRFASRYVGQVELAKGYGVAPIYQLERRLGSTATRRL